MLAMMVSAMPLFASAEDETPSGSAEPQITNGWNADKTMYYDGKGVPLRNVVKKINGKYYCFRSSGKVDKSKGWKKVSNGKYYIKKGRS